MKKKQKKKKSKKATDITEKDDSTEVDSKEQSVEPEDKGKSETDQPECDTAANTGKDEKSVKDSKANKVESEISENTRTSEVSDNSIGAGDKGASVASETTPDTKEPEPVSNAGKDKAVDDTEADLQKLKIDTSSPDIKSPVVPLSAYSSEIPFPEIDRSNTSYSEAAKAEIASLKNKISQLEATIVQLERENSRLRDHGDDDYDDYATMTLHPGDNRPRALSKTRKTSFVEIDLYGEASKISDIRRQMGQWKGWQVDMRGWRTHGIGPVLEL